jgi:Domain of unknown function (DUF4365)
MPITTSENDIKERLSIAYVTAVAARAGCQVVSLYVDKLSIDAMIRPVSGSAALVDLQLKATSQSLIVGLEVVYDLPIKNYDDLRASETNPHYLVILHLSGPAKDWLEVSVDELLLRGTAYWGNLHGLPSSSNSTTQRIRLPDTQRLTVDVIESMINQAPARIGLAGI